MSSAVRFVLFTILIDAIGFGIIIPVTPRLLMEVGGFGVADAARFGGLLSLLYAAFQFVFGPVMGNLGDRFGRRPVLVGSLAGFSVNFALMAIAPNLTWLLIGQALAGIFGSTYGPAQAALADVTEAKDRARVFGFVGAAFGAGFILGPVLGGLLGELGPRVPFYAAAGLAALNFVYGMTIFPETLTQENRRPFQWKRANPLGALLSLWGLPGLKSLGVVLLLWQIASLVYPLTWGYYMIAGFGATSSMIGLSLALVGIGMTVVQSLVTGPMVQRFGERRSAMIGLISATTAFIGCAIAPHFWPALLLMLFMPLGSLTQANLSAMVSQRGQADNQGEVQGFTAAIQSLGSIIAPLLLNPALAWFTSPAAPFQAPGAAFVIAALFALASLAVVARMGSVRVPQSSA